MIAQAIGILMVVCVVGMALGNIKVHGPDMSEQRLALPALAYAVTYPVATAAIIGTLVLLKRVFHIDSSKEAEAFVAEQQRRVEPREKRTITIENPTLRAPK